MVGRFHRRVRRSGIRALVIVLLAVPVHAQAAPDQGALGNVEQQIEKSGFEQRRLSQEIEHLTQEAQQNRLALVDFAKKIRAAEERISAAESSLQDSLAREGAMRRSLQARERVLGDVLAAMQRIGSKPPPALLVSPDDVLSAMRAAILLGAVLPDMRDEALALVADLKTLVALRQKAEATRQLLAQERDGMAAQRNRLSELVEARQKQISLSREQLEAERARVASLTREAKSLRELIARSDTDAGGTSRALEIARRAPQPQAATEMAALPAEGLKDAAKLQPRLAFAEMRGRMVLPVSGAIARQFGQADGLGGTEKGVTVLSARDAIVTAPADGWVHFAGPYRGYGHLLIINAGNGYHIVMAGMARLNVEIGQFVLAGEPIGYLGLYPALQSGEAIASYRAALYVEFRKDGSPIDPSPWFTPQSTEKARG